MEEKEENWIEVDLKVYSALFQYYRAELEVYSSITDTEGHGIFGNGKPLYVTVWSGKGKANPILKQEQTKESTEQKNWNVKCYINTTA